MSPLPWTVRSDSMIQTVVRASAGRSDGSCVMRC